MTDYQSRAHTTRSRRQAAGQYAKPTQAQAQAFALLLHFGADTLDKAQLAALATHPYLTFSQREKYSALAAK